MNKMDNPRKALGKGLTRYCHTRTQAPPAACAGSPFAPDPGTLPVDAIDPNPLQPRRVFQNERLSELAQSIRANGIIQPLVVRHVGDRYQLVAGERRWRAAKLAGLAARSRSSSEEIPDDRLLEITLIENIQREDLNPIETAAAFERLGSELNLNAEQIGAAHRKRPHHHHQFHAPAPASRRTSNNWSPNAASPPATPAAFSPSDRRTATRSRREEPSPRAGPSVRWSAPPRT